MIVVIYTLIYHISIYHIYLYHQPSRVLRSSSQLLLEVPITKTEFGRRAFSSALPQIWNDIPLPIRYSPSLDSFKRHLKTFLFTCSQPFRPGPLGICPHLRFKLVLTLVRYQSFCITLLMPTEPGHPSMGTGDCCGLK